MIRLKKLSTAVAAAAMLSAVSAQAAPVTVDGDFTIGVDGYYTFTFNSGAGLISGSIVEDPFTGADLSDTQLNGVSSVWTHSTMFSFVDSWHLAPISLNAGAQTITVFGMNGSDFHANFTYTDAPAPAVPEPETYAMMLAGLGVLGAMARRRQQKK